MFGTAVNELAMRSEYPSSRRLRSKRPGHLEATSRAGGVKGRSFNDEHCELRDYSSKHEFMTGVRWHNCLASLMVLTSCPVLYGPVTVWWVMAGSPAPAEGVRHQGQAVASGPKTSGAEEPKRGPKRLQPTPARWRLLRGN